ncbi:MAG: 4Fe-4S binding protein [Candidatus Altiarchaeota archaeon]
MPTLIVFELLKQFFEKPATNKFPTKYIPNSVEKFFDDVQKNRRKINPPIELPENFRGKLSYDSKKCIGCQLCCRVCPSKAIEFLAEKKKIQIYISRCTFCAQCVDVCPVKCLSSTNEFLLAGYDKYSKNLVVD